jgi:hypothetical protein
MKDARHRNGHEEVKVARDKADSDDQTSRAALLLLLKDAPDWTPVSEDEYQKILGVSRDTTFRMDKAGIGAPIVRLSARRKARTIGGIRNFIAARTATPSS